MKDEDFFAGKGLGVFLPGPVDIRPELGSPLLQRPFGHRDSEAHGIFDSIVGKLHCLAGSSADEYSVLLINGSGTNGMEACVQSLFPGRGESTAILSIGSFGELFFKISKAAGKDRTHCVSFPLGSAVDVAALERDSDAMSAELLVFTHNESSTGVANDLAELCAFAEAHGKEVVVDGVSIFGSVPLDLGRHRPLAYISATQKCLGLPAGFAIVFLRTDAARLRMAAVPSRGYTTDLALHLDFAGKSEVLTTPNCGLLRQMDRQLSYIVDEEGVENRFRRHYQLKEMVRGWASATGAQLFVGSSHISSPTLTAVRVPGDFDLDGLKRKMRDRGFLIDIGYGPTNVKLVSQGGFKIFRIPHMADTSVNQMEAYLQALGGLLGVGGANHQT